MDSEKFCLNCEKPLKGRADKKYCDEGCRNQYNNTLYAESSPIIRSTQRILKKNRSVLADILGEQEKYTTTLKYLKDKGFKPDYLTHLYLTKTGNLYKYSFEYGILELDDDKVLIVKKGNPKKSKKK